MLLLAAVSVHLFCWYGPDVGEQNTQKRWLKWLFLCSFVSFVYFSSWVCHWEEPTTETLEFLLCPPEWRGSGDSATWYCLQSVIPVLTTVSRFHSTHSRKKTLINIHVEHIKAPNVSRCVYVCRQLEGQQVSGVASSNLPHIFMVSSAASLCSYCSSENLTCAWQTEYLVDFKKYFWPTLCKL